MTAYRFKIPKDAEAWYSRQATDLTVNAPVVITSPTVCHNVKTDATQTNPVNFYLA